MNQLRKLYEWVLHWADTKYGMPALFILAFSESSFFPIPPDVLLIALAIGNRSKAFRFALVCSIGSIIGGIAGYSIGHFAWWSGKNVYSSLALFFFDHVPGFSVDIFQKNECPFELMHTNSSYPMKYEEANLNCIKTLKKEFNCKVGYSGHEPGASLVCVSAVLLGATSIERHITLDRTMYGSDQAASLEASGLQRLVRDIRLIDKILGDGKKRVWPSELPVQKKLRQKLA